jgi:chromosome segregation ATPase
MIFKANEKMD